MKHEKEQTEYLFVPADKPYDKQTIFKQSMNAQTGSSFLNEDTLSSSIKEEIKHEIEQTGCLFAPVAMKDDKLATSRQRMNAQTGSSFLNEDPLPSSIEVEIKRETEQTANLFAPVAMIDDKLATSRQNLSEEAIDDVDERSTESSLQTSKCVVCNKLKNNCICDNDIGKEYHGLNSFSFKENCMQITEKKVKEGNIISSILPINTSVFCEESFAQKSTLESQLSTHVVKKKIYMSFLSKIFY
ncbi:uncharacterized protein LOC142322421 [Lycorma delicatula]|uniref:uncharacterized protein LOC142322421 n=1 Tax=Lycorma delicatula TaxID=130591 RepID=UPI003F51365B